MSGFLRWLPPAILVVGLVSLSVVLNQWQAVWSHEQLLLVQQTTLRTPSSTNPSPPSSCWNQPPPVWPRALTVTQKRVPKSGARVSPATSVTYYDYDRGGNLIRIIPDDPSEPELWDLELTTGHSYYSYPSKRTCKPINFPVGILRPDWLEGATPLGPSRSTWRKRYHPTHSKDDDDDDDDRWVCGWTKADFIDYYADPVTGVPDSWYFHIMKASFYVLNYTAFDEKNNTIDPNLFVPPDYCP